MTLKWVHLQPPLALLSDAHPSHNFKSYSTPSDVKPTFPPGRAEKDGKSPHIRAPGHTAVIKNQVLVRDCVLASQGGGLAPAMEGSSKGVITKAIPAIPKPGFGQRTNIMLSLSHGRFKP